MMRFPTQASGISVSDIPASRYVAASYVSSIA